LIALADVLATSGPIEIEQLLAAFGRSSDEPVGLRLIEALRQSPATATVRAETLKPALENFGPKVREQAAAMYQTLAAELEKQRASMDALLALVKDGDARRGQQVFNSARAACAACHAIGYLGGNIGPDLTRVGQIRSERDLLEAIVEPSASFVRSYEPMQIETRSGKVYSGLVRGETAADLTLVVGVNQELRIPRDEIEALRPGKVSVMPTGLHQQLTGQELADLLAFLKSCR